MSSKVDFSTLTTEQLGDEYSDFFKAVYGFRDRGINYTNREMLIHSYTVLLDYMDYMKSTFEGREQLRADGWIIKEFEREDKIAARRAFEEKFGPKPDFSLGARARLVE